MESKKHIAWLEEILALLKSQRYRRSSKKLDALQGKLLGEAEMDAAIARIIVKLENKRAQLVAKHAAEEQTRTAKRSSDSSDLIAV